jgi:hypothetical protein
MKKSISLLCNLLLLSALYSSAVPSVEAGQMISSIPTDGTEYCHLKFSAIREDPSSWERPVFDVSTDNIDVSTDNIMDFYDVCDHGSLGSEEIRVQNPVIHRDDIDDGDQRLTSRTDGIRVPAPN